MLCVLGQEFQHRSYSATAQWHASYEVLSGYIGTGNFPTVLATVLATVLLIVLLGGEKMAQKKRRGTRKRGHNGTPGSP